MPFPVFPHMPRHACGYGRAPFLVVPGGWMAATATVALAEEVADLVRGERRARSSV